MEITGAPLYICGISLKMLGSQKQKIEIFSEIAIVLERYLVLVFLLTSNYIWLTSSIIDFMEFVDLHIYGRLRKITKGNYPKF